MLSTANLNLGQKLLVSVELSLLITFCMPSWAGAVAVPSTAQIQASDDSVLLCPGVIVAPKRQAVYAMAPSGEVEAIDLSSGALHWQSAAASKPLALHGNLLVAHAEASSPKESAKAVVFDVERRGRVEIEISMALPASAWHRIDDGLGASLRSEAVGAGDQVSLLWESTRRQVQGAAALAGPADSRRKAGAPEDERVRGGLQLDLASGAVVPFGAGLDAPSMAAERPRILEGTGRLQGLRDTGIQFLSADGQHVLTSTRIADEQEWNRYRWHLHERASGRFVGMVSAHRSHADFVVSESTLLYVTLPTLRRADEDRWDESPRSLRAMDLVSGAELWTHPIRDTRYYGPFPP